MQLSKTSFGLSFATAFVAFFAFAGIALAAVDTNSIRVNGKVNDVVRPDSGFDLRLYLESTDADDIESVRVSYQNQGNTYPFKQCFRLNPAVQESGSNIPYDLKRDIYGNRPTSPANAGGSFGIKVELFGNNDDFGANVTCEGSSADTDYFNNVLYTSYETGDTDDSPGTGGGTGSDAGNDDSDNENQQLAFLQQQITSILAFLTKLTADGQGTGGGNGSDATRQCPPANVSTVKLQVWLVDNGYMTQAEMNTGPGIYGPRTTRAFNTATSVCNKG